VVPVFAVNLTSVNVGGIEVVNVDAVVVPSDMPMVLLGNSFLSRFSMRREGDVMRLEKR
jgi:aspartyl protease family protein